MTKDDRREAVLYLICGIVAMGVSWATQFLVSLICFGNPLYPSPVQNIILGLSNWTAGMLSAYVMNRKLVFRSSKPIGPEFLKFAVARLATLGVDLILRQVLPFMGLNVYITTLVVSVVITALNYITGKLAVFRPVKNQKGG